VIYDGNHERYGLWPGEFAREAGIYTGKKKTLEKVTGAYKPSSAGHRCFRPWITLHALAEDR